MGIDYTPASPEEIMKYLNEHPNYRCLPDMPPTSLEELKKAESEKQACEKSMKERDSIFKAKDLK